MGELTARTGKAVFVEDVLPAKVDLAFTRCTPPEMAFAGRMLPAKGRSAFAWNLSLGKISGGEGRET
ncbi:MAG: hypothetical protein LAP21_07920 [Acidobacteriia bacterium]|nr:hypothetical protein [Terriglobia bacterium]